MKHFFHVHIAITFRCERQRGYVRQVSSWVGEGITRENGSQNPLWELSCRFERGSD